MKTKQAKIKVSNKNEALWIYWEKAIQCFKCGWWQDNVILEEALKLYQEHICHPDK